MLLLAAGESRRLGQSKQLLDIEGRPLIVHILDKVIASGLNEIFVVTGAYREKVEAAIGQFPVHIVYNEKWEEGMGTSISTGVRQIEKFGKYQAVLILLCDQYRLTENNLREMIMLTNDDPAQIVTSVYEGIEAVPVLFKKPYFSELKDLTGDTGARKIIRKYLKYVTRFPFPEGKFDLDTTEDYEKLLSNFS